MDKFVAIYLDTNVPFVSKRASFPGLMESTRMSIDELETRDIVEYYPHRHERTANEYK